MHKKNNKEMIILITTLILFIAGGCTKESPVTQDNDLIVVRGYLYANEPVNDVQITGTLHLGSEETKAPPINDAIVILKKDGNSYNLAPSAGDSGYYHYDGVELVVGTGDVFTIEVTANGQQAQGQTVVPQAPENLKSSKTSISLPDFDTLRELRQQGVSMDSIRSSMTIEITWDNEAEALYYVVVENIDDNPVEVETGIGKGPREYISHPVASGQYMVDAIMMTHFGRHEIRVYRVNQEYADLYQSRKQDSRDLNEPLTNIENGLGIFSAFNSQTVYLNFAQ